MGFSGLLLLARSEDPLADLPSVSHLEVEERKLEGSWRAGQIKRDFTDPEALAAALVRYTGSPALAAYVFDSDFAQVNIDSPGGVRHWFYVDNTTAVASFEPWDDPPEPPSDEETVALVQQWAAEAGLETDDNEILFALQQYPPGEGIDDLYRALGVMPR
ncbi:MAG TPA: hypothetical protein DGT23_26215 [Micromonosporaceae bacterium]|nr:hypothetical protein [Micromonosporaceae bacterium]